MRFSRRVVSALRWRFYRARYARGLCAPRTEIGSPSDDQLPVIMCLWNRRERLDDALRMLDAQHTGRRIRLMLWNNRRSDAGYYRDRIRAFRATGALASVELFSSRLNVGGMGRFYLAARLRRRGVTGAFVMLDDDQNVSPDFVEHLLAASGPTTVAGWWAWRMDGEYWFRTPAEPGDRVSYVGTGGCACDIAIVDLPGFLTDLPRYFGFVEDLWMCGRARQAGWRLVKVETPIEFVLDETNQHHTQGDLKTEFYRYLRLGALDAVDAREAGEPIDE